MAKRLFALRKSLSRVLVFVFLSLLALSRPFAQTRSTLALLDRYAAGDFAAVADDIANLHDYGDVVKDLKSEATQQWLDAGGPQDRNRRELAAATFALEAARADEWREWKWWVATPGVSRRPTLYWMAPPVLIEWGCELLRQHQEPLPAERLWQLAAMSVAQRGEDTQFLIGFTAIEAPSVPEPVRPAATPLPSIPGLPFAQIRQAPPNFFRDEVANPQAEIGHLNHVVERFPAEKRFVLGEALARERPSVTDALKAYTSLLDDRAVGGEATVRLGALYLRRNDVPHALQRFDQAERLTRDPYLLYLAVGSPGTELEFAL